jgi:pyruvate formate lyase activating enzyme
MNILGLNKTTLLDYPEHVAATIFIGGCNYRCPFCHNMDIVFQNENIPKFSTNEIISFLHKRKNILTGVCITGGEPTLNHELPDLIRQIKDIGYKIKLDTNGTNPTMISNLIDSGLIDYCAMDIKNCREKYALTCGMDVIDISKVEESVSILNGQDKIEYEFRTTIVKQLHNTSDIIGIANWIKGAPRYFLQSYKDCPQVIKSGYSAYNEAELEHFLTLCREYIPNTHLRGI